MLASNSFQQGVTPDARPPVDPPKNDLDLSLFVPRYKVTKMGYEMGGNSFAVHMRRKYVKLPLFVRSFHFACYVAFLKSLVHPEERFIRMHYQKDYYSRSNGKLRKNVKQSAKLLPYLSWHKEVDTYKDRKSTYYSITARFTDPNSNVNYGFTVRAWSVNVTMWITKEMRERIGDPENFDYPKFFTRFLQDNLNYHKAVYVLACKYHVLHRLYALQKDMKEAMTTGDFY